MRRKAEEDVDLFSDNDEDAEVINPITPEQYQTLMEYLEERNKPAVLPVQIAYYTGLRLGEVCGLSWSDINFEEQYLTVREVAVTTEQGTRPRLVRQSERKSVSWISVIRSLTS